MPDTFRTERDSMGEMRVPSEAYYGAQTARAVENFPVSGLRFGRRFIRALGLVKKYAARANEELGLLPPDAAGAIRRAAQEVADGVWDQEFVVDIFQTGSGTSTNMNANEVIANRAGEMLGAARGARRIHPNDQVNLGQSSNDVIPTSIHLAALEAIETAVLPAAAKLHSQLLAKSREFWKVRKIGRTHLQDATPMRLGQEFLGYAGQVQDGTMRLRSARDGLLGLALGGTAVGTGINTHPEFASRAIAGLATEYGLPLRETENHFAAQGSIDGLVAAAGAAKGFGLSLAKVANDIRWLGSGPRCGLGEILLPPTQPGSSIMPGKVNPVMAEMLVQVCAQVVGNEAAIAFAATQGAFELNTMLPVTARNLLESLELLARGAAIFGDRCVAGLEADVARCAGYVERSLALGTALVPAIGYDRAAEIAKTAYASGKTVREVAKEVSGLPAEEVDRLLEW